MPGKLLIPILLVIFLPFALAAPPSVTIDSPVNLNISHKNNLTFFCNATADGSVYNISLYSNFNGNFSINSTKNIMELESDQNTTLLCHFNGNHVCNAGETGINSSILFESSRFISGVLMNNSATLRYPAAGKLGFTQGTIEFWVNIGFNTTSQNAWFFDMQTLDINEITIFAFSGILYFELYDTFGSVARSQVDITPWQQGEWHHIAAVWNTPESQQSHIYVDGSDANVTDPNNEFDQATSVGQYIYLGSSAAGTNQAKSLLDEFRISNVVRSETEINASYFKGALNHSNEQANFSLIVQDGAYSWNCLAYDNQSQSAFASSNFTVYVDNHSAPLVNSLTFLPNNADDVDPGVALNFTANITDLTNISKVTLQYKYDIDWINATMTSQSNDIWNVSVQTVGSERVYQYRILANDTIGNVNTSSEYSTNVTLDYTWAMSPSNTTAYGIKNSVAPVCIIVINNTGDDTLNIDISDDWPIIDVFYNTTNPFSLAAKSVLYVNVTAKFAETDGTRNMSVTMTADPSAPGKTASPASNTTIVSMVSYGGGSFIEMGAVSSSNSVLQGSLINISVTFRNIGNETAYNVSLNWSLPAGWVNISGSVGTFIDNISNRSETNTSAITTSLNSLAESGSVTVCANATVNYNATYSSCKVISVSCSNTDGVCGIGCFSTNDADCPAPASGGGSGSGSASGSVSGIVATKYVIKISTPAEVHAYRGTSVSFAVNLSPGQKDFRVVNVTLRIFGYPQTNFVTDRSIIEELSNGSQLIVTLLVPSYIENGRHNITFAALGTIMQSSSATGSADVALFVHAATEKQASDMLRDAGEALKEIRGRMINSSSFEASLGQANLSFSKMDYDTTVIISQSIIQERDAIFSALGLIVELSEKIIDAESYGVDATESRKMYQLSQLAFERGDYRRSRERAITGLTVYDAEARSSILQAKFFAGNWPYMAIVSVILLFSVVIGKKGAGIIIARQKLVSMKKEENVVRSMTRYVQRRFFGHNEMGKNEYEETRKSYLDRLAIIQQEKIKYTSRSHPLSRHDKKSRIVKLMKGLQRDRFIKGTVSRDTYDKIMNSLKKELADEEKKL